LKAEGLALELSSYHNDYMNLFTLFEIKIKLTQKGLDNPNHVKPNFFWIISIYFSVNVRS